ncbi:MAG: hypothetical protein NTY83_02145 [Candidatus Micrarchaeota archaeon]|nr:hypothetical protein [Candidatus Micrarchaeota archaeon]
MASTPPRASGATSDTMMPSAPFAQASHWLLRAMPEAKPQPERPKTNAILFYEDRCDILSDILCRNDNLLQKRINAALSLSGVLKKISDEKMISDAVYLLTETMLDDSEHPALRMACAVSLGSSGAKDFVQEMKIALKSEEPPQPKEPLQSKLLILESPAICRSDEAIGLFGMVTQHSDVDEIVQEMEIALKSKESVQPKPKEPIQSKLLILKSLAICRSDEAIELLGRVAQYGSVDELCLAAARELIGIPLYPAQKIVARLIANPPGAYIRHPDFMSEFCRLAECDLTSN